MSTNLFFLKKPSELEKVNFSSFLRIYFYDNFAFENDIRKRKRNRFIPFYHRLVSPVTDLYKHNSHEQCDQMAKLCLRFSHFLQWKFAAYLNFFAKGGWKHIKLTPLNNWQRFSTFCQSGEILLNLVTLGHEWENSSSLHIPFCSSKFKSQAHHLC